MVFSSFQLAPEQLQRLKQHKYQAQGTSVLEPVLQIYWRWLVTKVPLWVAPNLITFVGLIINLVTTAPILILDPNAEGMAPSWSYVACAIGFFIYQSLDAIDGKQARRTNTNNPLGELFDHGCDAISGMAVLFSALSAVATHDFPLLMQGFALLLSVLTYCYHWQTYVSGVLYFKRFDVTEAQYTHIGLLLLAGFGGRGVMLYKLPVVDLEFRMVVVLGAYFMSIVNGIIAFHIILTGGVGKNGSTVADTSVLSPIVLPVIQTAMAVLYTSYSPVPLREYCMLFFMAMVVPLAKSIIRLLIASMTKSPMPMVDICLVAPFLALLNVYFGILFPEKIVLFIVMVINVVDITTMSMSVCQQIAKSLEVYVFTIPSQAPSPQLIKKKQVSLASQ